MNRVIIIFLWIMATHIIFAQSTIIVFQPDAICGKDALLTSLNPGGNYGTHPDFLATAWTNSGSPVNVRSLIAFDLSGIPIGTNITEATLELFHRNSTANIGHSTLSGPNDASLYRVTQNWTENTVTWSTQPNYTTTNSVYLSASAFSTQNYTLNVTALLQDMVNDPTNSFGFMFKENVESYYRSLLFASSDEASSTLHPKLTVVLEDSLNITGPCVTTVFIPDTTSSPTNTTVVVPADTIDISPIVVISNGLIIPNVFTPNSDQVNEYWTITFPEGYTFFDVAIYNRWGNLIFKSEEIIKPWFGRTFSGEPCSDGVYFYLLRYRDDNNREQKKSGHISLYR